MKFMFIKELRCKLFGHAAVETGREFDAEIVKIPERCERCEAKTARLEYQ